MFSGRLGRCSAPAESPCVIGVSFAGSCRFRRTRGPTPTRCRLVLRLDRHAWKGSKPTPRQESRQTPRRQPRALRAVDPRGARRGVDVDCRRGAGPSLPQRRCGHDRRRAALRLHVVLGSPGRRRAEGCGRDCTLHCGLPCTARRRGTMDRRAPHRNPPATDAGDARAHRRRRRDRHPLAADARDAAPEVRRRGQHRSAAEPLLHQRRRGAVDGCVGATY